MASMKRDTSEDFFNDPMGTASPRHPPPRPTSQPPPPPPRPTSQPQQQQARSSYYGSNPSRPPVPAQQGSYPVPSAPANPYSSSRAPPPPPPQPKQAPQPAPSQPFGYSAQQTPFPTAAPPPNARTAPDNMWHSTAPTPTTNETHAYTTTQTPSNAPESDAWFSSPTPTPTPTPTTTPFPTQPIPSNTDPMQGPIQTNTAPTTDPNDEYANEPPLMEELGINIPHILAKSRAVILPASRKTKEDEHLMDDNDLAGPLVFALTLGGELLLSAKMHFGYIYGFGMFGCLAMALILNLMAPPDSPISVWTVCSILGYSLIPVNLLALVNIFVRIKYLNKIGIVLACCTILWCTAASTRLMEKCGMRNQRYLVGYPAMLIYSAFVILTIF